ncbi:MAG: glutathione S-transferase family protein [Roseibium sp.]
MSPSLTLVSHTLCPYVQRAAIVLKEKEISFERVYIDLANKPDWFRNASPLGKVPLLKTGTDEYLFESAPIVEYLDETLPGQLHPEDPVARARHRAYVEFASQILNGIGSLYNANDANSFQSTLDTLRSKFEHLETVLHPSGPFFSGPDFSLVDAAFGPVFRYFDVIEEFTNHGLFDGLAGVNAWRSALTQRPSVRLAVTKDYARALRAFFENRYSWISGLMAKHDTSKIEATE